MLISLRITGKALMPLEAAGDAAAGESRARADELALQLSALQHSAVERLRAKELELYRANVELRAQVAAAFSGGGPIRVRHQGCGSQAAEKEWRDARDSIDHLCVVLGW